VLASSGRRRHTMKRTTGLVLIGCVILLAGCGEPIKGIDADAKAAKSQAHDAV
jgi:hypothetical protein